MVCIIMIESIFHSLLGPALELDFFTVACVNVVLSIYNAT